MLSDSQDIYLHKDLREVSKIESVDAMRHGNEKSLVEEVCRKSQRLTTTQVDHTFVATHLK